MLDLLTYDVFTDTPFLGNPLAIVPRAEALTTKQMQTLAQELNLSETIFVMPPDDPVNTAKVRIFYPKAEIAFAGHPTIGCAVHLSGLIEAQADATVAMTLEEEAGLVPVRVQRENGRVTAEFTAPLLPVRNRVITDKELTADALGLDARDIGNATVAMPEVWQAGPSYLLVPVASVDALGRARPTGSDWDRLTERAGTISAWLFTSDAENCFRARMFSPAGGTPEDPATGSAVVTFAGLLACHGHCTRAETSARVLQGVEMGRRSEIQARIMLKDGELSAVRIGGCAVPISSSRIRIP
ncbi:trans-2,3-dihydro-3-hydroxyanthranilate isomerase [Roseivivax lentus]|uniref:Trans-2,3-dihydro-3-hydroxyanthranilate isomerase n=1 Tax=Roseivivax lentus TaxID=633194 RepID=A0A1N7N2K4_9RHOB|nr:PhzF family phenazine biosynthesis protein [Roseivivax lentus]SIS92607.1 trans-2,3-dihydro-3-hydroxyanthranilate isomerase [Roseivivax lentus]